MHVNAVARLQSDQTTPILIELPTPDSSIQSRFTFACKHGSSTTRAAHTRLASLHWQTKCCVCSVYYSRVNTEKKSYHHNVMAILISEGIGAPTVTSWRLIACSINHYHLVNELWLMQKFALQSPSENSFKMTRSHQSARVIRVVSFLIAFIALLCEPRRYISQ